ncbi:MAG: hypothetical protein F4246_07225 [Rhodothermaceae bacterium]|nr:hypothetical protein [Rhodothermaceae bacterium]MYD20414.1 hypothetical protein [Rhodothermaceae bacterium]MYD56787.1 hypothetical protein [Rhodothermaceae bacterium]MYI44253.1 hypothetical protein [Rhodothermaceae bacterium]MYJ55086.1 hypothetical protein [Rhodothermaceae bacterium]
MAAFPGKVRAISMAIAAIPAPQLASLDRVFQYIQEYTGFVSPGVRAIFVLVLVLEEINGQRCIDFRSTQYSVVCGHEMRYAGDAVP